MNEKFDWAAHEKAVREAFAEWASYRLKVLEETSTTEWTDGRIRRYRELLEAVGTAEGLARAWSATLDSKSSTAKGQYLTATMRTGEALARFLGRVTGLMHEEIGLLPGIRRAFEASQRSGRRPQELLFRRYERRLPSHGIPENFDLMAETALYALYVACSPASKVVIPDNRRELWRAIVVDQESLKIVTPRRFEELVGFVYEQLGCRVEVTKASRDGGADVLAWQPGPFGTESLIVVQTKLYSGESKVDTAGVHALHGAVAHYNANHGHLVATSDVTGPARKFLDKEGYKVIDLAALKREVALQLE